MGWTRVEPGSSGNSGRLQTMNSDVKKVVSNIGDYAAIVLCACMSCRLYWRLLGWMPMKTKCTPQANQVMAANREPHCNLPFACLSSPRLDSTRRAPARDSNCHATNLSRFDD